MFYRFDRAGTTVSSLRKAYQTPERDICDILRAKYRSLIQEARKAS